MRGNSRKLGNFWSREEEEEDQSERPDIAQWESGDPVAAPARSTGWKVEPWGDCGEPSRALTDSRERPRGPGFKEQQGAPLKSERLSSMLLFLLLGFLPILARVVWAEAVTLDTDECLRGAKARHGDDPNDELDSFLACVLARLDAVSFVFTHN